jgi:hypothetical protein
MQRSYHFVSLRHGLDDLRQRHLKISQLDDLNDPFELWAIAQPDRRLRQSIKATKVKMSRQFGLLCFSLDWHNPVLWSHYADRHRGLALGFDVDEEILNPVSYRKTRPVLTTIDGKVAQWLLFTKYIGWDYEQEARIFTSLEDRDPETSLYFANFSKQLILREVIAGPLCTATEQELREATGSTPEIKFTRARLAFKTFRVVTDRRGFAD